LLTTSSAATTPCSIVMDRLECGVENKRKEVLLRNPAAVRNLGAFQNMGEVDGNILIIF